MAIRHQILGHPGRDNALFVTVDTGQSLHRLLFDCGEGVLSEVPVAEVQQVERLFFSHFHFDHVAGFDSFFRLNWCRPESEKPVRVFGPGRGGEVIHHRLQGVTWNLGTPLFRADLQSVGEQARKQPASQLPAGGRLVEHFGGHGLPAQCNRHAV